MIVGMNEIEITAQLHHIEIYSIPFRYTQISDLIIFDFILKQENEIEDGS